MLTIDQIANALKAKAGNITEAGKALGVSRWTLHKRINESPTLQTVLKDSREELVDIAELALRREVISGNITAIIWTLKASPEAKRRGWGEKHEHSGPENGPIETKQVFDHGAVVASVTTGSGRYRDPSGADESGGDGPEVG